MQAITSDEDPIGSGKSAVVAKKKSKDRFGRGNLLFWQCKYKEAMQYFEMLQKQDTLSPNELIRCYNSLGAVHSELKNYDEALANYHKQLVVLQNSADLEETKKAVVKCYRSIGKIYWLKKDSGQATYWYQRAFNALPTISEDLQLTSNIYKDLANLYTESGEFESAMSCFSEALMIDRDQLRENHPMLGQTYANMGVMHCGRQDYENALDYFYRALELWEESLSPTHVYVESMANTIHQVEAKLRKYLRLTSVVKEKGELEGDLNVSHGSIQSTYHKSMCSETNDSCARFIGIPERRQRA